MKQVFGLCIIVVLLAGSTAGFNFDTSQVSVSGLSSGAFQAVQFQFAFSANTIGLGIFAGGPYYCAQGSEITATTACMMLPEEINIEDLISDAKQFASAGYIDDLANLNGQPIYLYSGQFDTVVNRGVVELLQQQYQALNPNSNVTTTYDIDSEHCIPTMDYGNMCIMLESPYINKCNFDGAGAALQAIYMNTLNPAGNSNENNLMTLTQTDFVPSAKSSSGVAPNAYVYVPTNCQNGTVACKFHVSFHGCNQDYEAVGNAYYYNAGFNTWAESNNIIVLYPQASTIFIKNPEGCFDWWGFTGSDYAYKTGVQSATTWNMIAYLGQQNTTFHN